MEKINSFSEFLNESNTADWKRNFLESVVESFKEGPHGRYDSVTLDLPNNTVIVDTSNVIDDNKAYSVLDISRPTINLDYQTIMKFDFDENALKKYASHSYRYGLSEVKFDNLFKVKVAVTLEVTIDELEDFYHKEGNDELVEVDIDTDFPNEKDFLEGFHQVVDEWMEELYSPMRGQQDPLRSWLDDYEKRNDDFLNETERRSVAKKSPMTSTLRKSLDRIGKSLKTDEEIIKAIEALGFKREPLNPKATSAEHVFISGYNEDGVPFKYITYSNGYVRAIMPKGWRWGFSNQTHNMTPVVDQYIPTTRDRLLLVLRRALKQSNIYKVWIKTNLSSDDPVAEFFERKRGHLMGMKYGL